jgi:indole-3-glycerol phosphate synthase
MYLRYAKANMTKRILLLFINNNQEDHYYVLQKEFPLIGINNKNYHTLTEVCHCDVHLSFLHSFSAYHYDVLLSSLLIFLVYRYDVHLLSLQK